MASEINGADRGITNGVKGAAVTQCERGDPHGFFGGHDGQQKQAECDE